MLIFGRPSWSLVTRTSLLQVKVKDKEDYRAQIIEVMVGA